MGSSEEFERPYRVRFDEAGTDGLLRASGLLRFAQDVAWQHSEWLALDRGWYREAGLTWLVRGISMDLLGLVGHGRTIGVSTQIRGLRRALARRHTRFVLAGTEQTCATVDTDWLLVDQAGRPVKIPDLVVERLEAVSTFDPVRVALPPMPPHLVALRSHIRRADVDPLGHMNNAAYLDLIDESLAADAGAAAVLDGPRRYRVEYARAAVAGSDLVVTTWPSEAGHLCRIGQQDGVELVRALVTALDGQAAPTNRS